MNHIITLFLGISLLAPVAQGAEKKKAPAAPPVTLETSRLTGTVHEHGIDFVLRATARVEDPKGGTIDLLSGGVALRGVGENPKWRFRVETNRYVAVFDRSGKFPLEVRFSALVKRGAHTSTVSPSRGGGEGIWSSVDFRVAPALLQPITLEGLPENTEFEFVGAAKPERQGDSFISFLPSDGSVKLWWKEQRPETEGKLFYSAEMLSQVSVSPGLMRQGALLNVRVMQGELRRLVCELKGAGEVTRVQGEHVLSWQVEEANPRRLVIQFNEAQKEQLTLQIQMQTPLAAFPQTVEAIRLTPEGATRFAGYYRVVNDGAVRLEVTSATGLSQVSPEQFPESDVTKAAFPITGNQRFAFRFSSGDSGLQIMADQVQPELTVSEVLAFFLGENELAIEGEFEVEIREAPLRELVVRVPKGYGLARLTASGMADYFLRDLPDTEEAELRLVYGQPVTGRQLVQLRLERTKALTESVWDLPAVRIPGAKSVRGHVGMASEAGFRLTPERSEGLTEIANAFFPRKATGLQAAYRLSEPAWQARVKVERLPLSVQADSFHLFSIGEGIAYGSSVMNFLISGAPVSAFRVELSEEYSNVEFTGKDVRNWQKVNGVFLVQLHSPVAGPYTLLATYERTFKSQGDTLNFAGARPLDAQSDAGHTLVVSAHQFEVKAVEVSAGLLQLETAEVPSEYRLFFEAPILAAYRYNSRPFNLKLALAPLAQTDSLNLVVDRGLINTRISKEGEVITDAQYCLKNRGNSHLRLTLPEGTDLRAATVNNARVVPVKDGAAYLVPLPQRTDPNSPMVLNLKYASRSKDPQAVSVATPALSAPVMLAEWKLRPDERQELHYRKGSLTPAYGATDYSGFAALTGAFSGHQAATAWISLAGLVVFLVLGLLLWRVAADPRRVATLRVIAGLLGACALILSFAPLVSLGDLLEQHQGPAARELVFVAPIQQAGSTLALQVDNVEAGVSVAEAISYAWPMVLGVLLLGVAALRRSATLVVVGWGLLAWGVLRLPNGGVPFLWLLAAFIVLHVIVPGARRIWQTRPVRKTVPTAASGTGPHSPVADAGAAPAITVLLLGGLLAAGLCPAYAEDTKAPATIMVPRAAAVTNEVVVEDLFASGEASLRWQARKGEMLPLLFEPAVLTRLSYDTNNLRLVRAPAGSRVARQLLALRDGAYAVELGYQVQAAKRDNETGFRLPVPYGLVNSLNLTLLNQDVDVLSPEAVLVQRNLESSNTVARVALIAVDDAWIAWKPRSRDVRSEQAVFYAELVQLYAPAAGVIEGAHRVTVRPAQGQLSDLTFTIPQGVTITDVADAARPASQTPAAPGAADSSGLVSLWRFDPDTRKLRVAFKNPQSKLFVLVVRSQASAGTLPFEKQVGLVTVERAANQIGLLGIATGNEVQLDSVATTHLSPVNLEDFPADALAVLQCNIAGLTVRRAFRYSGGEGTATLKASAVEPDVRVETQDTVSLGEDRTVLAANATVEITRAGIFKLSFEMPQGFDVESISSPAMSHWTELKSDQGRIVTMHLNGKTEGRHTFTISLAGPGIKKSGQWAVPRIAFREAAKHRGTLLVVPEQGLRPQMANSEGLTQLDPQKAGIKQKGVLAFRVLQAGWTLALDVEQVPAWIQVATLQHVNVGEAQVKVTANIQYQIENTGMKTLRVFLPTNAESVRFQGEQLADHKPLPGTVTTNGTQLWEVKLQRRVIGTQLLQVHYQVTQPEQAREAVIRGIEVADVNMQRGFITVQSSGRLQLKMGNLPDALQAAEYQSIPKPLQKDLQSAPANFTYRVVEPAFALPLQFERHDAARLLAANVNNLTLTSVVSDDGAMLTQIRMELVPGDKRFLSLTLPPDARFWFAFVDQKGVWPWREKDRLLVPLEQTKRDSQPVTLEIFYTCKAGSGTASSLNLNLLAPKFDLPLENVAWQVALGTKWRLKDWKGALQLQHQEQRQQPVTVDLQTYLQTENELQIARSREAEKLIAEANSALAQGDPQQARRAFRGAYSLSTHDAAFNEDARVQLHNTKLQQAVVGLNVRQAATAGDTTAIASKVQELKGRKEVNYTQQEAKTLLEQATAEEAAAFTRLAERLIQQQEAAAITPTAIRANIPDQGQVFTFKRAVVVDTWADLKLSIEAAATKKASTTTRLAIMGGLALLLAGIVISTRAFAKP